MCLKVLNFWLNRLFDYPSMPQSRNRRLIEVLLYLPVNYIKNIVCNSLHKVHTYIRMTLKKLFRPFRVIMQILYILYTELYTKPCNKYIFLRGYILNNCRCVNNIYI